MAVAYPDRAYPVYYWPGYYWPTVGVNVLPIREQILDAIKAALQASTGIHYVTDRKESWWDWGQNRYPGVCIITGDEEDRRFCYSDSTAFTDMQSKMRVSVIGYVFDKSNNLGTKRSDLIGAIEKAVSNDSTVTGLVGDIVLNKVQTDKGVLENFSVVNCEFGLDYLYNKVIGG
jgi:hypothetical protein